MAAPHLDIKTILTTNSGSRWAPVGGTTLRPDPPTLTPSVVTSTTITVTLSVGSGLTSRIPYRNGTALAAISGSATSFQFTGLSANTPYTLWFIDEKNGRFSAASVSLQITTDNPPVVIPAVPTLSFVSKDSNSITVNSSGSTGATSYIPIRNGTTLAEVTTFPYTFTGLTSSTQYTLTFRAKNSAGTSADSNAITQTTDAAISVLTVPMKAALYGGTNFTDQEEIARRAKFDLFIMQSWYGISASMVQTHLNAVRALNPSIKVILYLMLEGISDTDDLGAFLTTNNMWARDSWPSGNRLSVWPNTHGSNLAGTRTVNGFTCGESLVNLHAAKNGAVWNMVDGIMIDNQWYTAGYDYDYDEDGVNNSAKSAAMRDAHAIAYQKIVARIKHFHPEFQIWGNPRAPTANLQIGGTDDKAAFVAQKWDGFMQQNAGPGLYWHNEGVFAYDSNPALAGLTNYRTWPAEATISATPAHGQLLRNAWGSFARHSTLPATQASLGDIAYEHQTGGWIANTQNILQECFGFTETEEVTYASLGASQHNRACLGYWWVLTDVAPYLYGLDTAGGRSIWTEYHEYFKGQQWIDPPAILVAPYATIGGHPVYLRRTLAGAMIFIPRRAAGAAASAPATMTINTPALPPGKTTWTTWTGGGVGSTLSVPGNRDTVFLKAL